MILLILLLQAFPLVSGKITSGGEPVPHATVAVEGTAIGTAADSEGRYRLELRPGDYSLAFSAVGYRSRTLQVSLRGGHDVRLDVELQEKILLQEEVVVTGTLRETYVTDSPVKVEVVPRAYLDRVNSSNLMDAMNYVAGMQVQVECGVCYTNNIRINGMDGPYTAVLIDGMPIMSSLATVYGLNSISPALVRQVEIIRGPASTLYGSEALAGVINIRTERPDHAPRLFAQTRLTSDLQTTFDASASLGGDASGGLVSASAIWMDRFVDYNGDDFSDVPLIRRLSLFGKYERGVGLPATQIAARLYWEDRWGGQSGWTRSQRGSSEIYAESVITRRLELLGSHRFGPARAGRIDAAYNLHDQDSFYGDVPFRARQQTLYSTATWASDLSAYHHLLLGLSGRLDDYVDDTPVTNSDEQRFVPGVFTQLESAASDQVTVVSGMRMDRHRRHGVIFSPRLSARYRPRPETTVRINAGTGFRVVNLFTEDHAALTGSREIILAEELRPERSWNLTLNLNHIIPFRANPLVLDLDVFRTYFSNQIVPNYDEDPNAIIYRNLDGHAVTRGTTINLSQSFTSFPLEYSVGVTILDARTVESDVRRSVVYAPRVQGVASASYRDPITRISFDYTARMTGQMQMPRYAEPFARPETSDPFSVHNILLTRKLSHYASGATHRDIEAFIGIDNVFDYVQPSPLIDPGNPFGENFDTTYIYGPLRGRTFSAGLRFLLE